ncbi:unnamed protein product, partial [marine sediment metagenome]
VSPQAQVIRLSCLDLIKSIHCDPSRTLTYRIRKNCGYLPIPSGSASYDPRYDATNSNPASGNAAWVESTDPRLAYVEWDCVEYYYSLNPGDNSTSESCMLIEIQVEDDLNNISNKVIIRQGYTGVWDWDGYLDEAPWLECPGSSSSTSSSSSSISSSSTSNSSSSTSSSSSSVSSSSSSTSASGPSWVSYGDNTYWTVAQGTWNGSGWDAAPGKSGYGLQLNELGSWNLGFRPTKIRVTYNTTGANMTLEDTNFGAIVPWGSYTS